MAKFRNFILGCALIITPSMLSAQTSSVDTINQKKVLKSLNADNIAPVLKTITGNHYGVVDDKGHHYIIATASNGLKFEIFFHGCEDPDAADLDDMKCRGLSMVSTWGAGPNPAQLNALVPPFLRNNPLINAGQLDNGDFYLTRYVIADHGVAQGNLLSEIANYIRIASNFANTMSQASATPE